MKFLANPKLNSIFSLVLVVVLLTSCSGSPENLKIIPKETVGLVSIDVFSLIKKGDLDDLGSLESISSFMEEVKSEDKDAANILDGLLNDPTKLGIDFRKHVYAYSVKEDEGGVLTCVSAELWSADKLEELIEEVASASGMPLKIQDADACRYVMLGPAVLGWDEDKLLLVANPNAYFGGFDGLGALNKMFALEPGDQITSVEGFSSFLEGAQDIDAWVAMDMLMEEREFREAMQMLNYDVTGSTLMSHLNFDDDNITLSYGFEPGDGMLDKMQEHDIFNNTFNSDLFKYLPEEHFAVLSYSIDPVAYYEFIKTLPDFAESEVEVERELGMKLSDLAGSIGGNVVASFFGIEEMEYTTKDYGYAFDEAKAVLQESGKKINELGYISSIDKDKLSAGETIEAYNYRGYCFDIKNVLEAGGNLESAIANNSEVNWYQGGWTFGRNIEKTVKEFVPLFAMTGDLKNSEGIKMMLSKMPEEELIKKDNYWMVSPPGSAPMYITYTEEAMIVTNDISKIESFNNGGVEGDNLGDSDVASDISAGNYYGYMNLNFNDYPSDAVEMMFGSSRMLENPTVQLWMNFIEANEMKEVNDYNGEMILHVLDEGDNSLKEIIENIDESL